jgi:flagellar biosynthesis/type III secretory pathway chaperone
MNQNTEFETKSVESSADKNFLYQELCDCLENLVKVYRSLLEIVRKEKDILAASQLDELNENNRAKDAMIIRVRSLENSRIKCARDFAAVVGADQESPRLLDIASYCKGEWAVRLHNLHSVLELLVKRVSEVNKQNENLVQSALKNITGAMEAIKDGLQPKSTYARQGQLANSRAENGNIVSREG